jgi:hypothetical protein
LGPSHNQGKIGDKSGEVSICLFVFVNNLIPGDIFFDGLVFGIEEPRPALRAELALVIDDRLTIRAFLQGHADILPQLRLFSQTWDIKTRGFDYEPASCYYFPGKTKLADWGYSGPTKRDSASQRKGKNSPGEKIPSNI